ncbi:HipA domain-containing protein [Pseudomonas sp. NPDC007930]|uniref:type II toxin-antitoxin system HipA family toxin n=1 Tax=Pseudomonas sp. NPDC007930 TaxID=3364417 RepID=UPI0036E1E116
MVAGRLVPLGQGEHGPAFGFIYGKSYLANPRAIPLNSIELPLGEQTIAPAAGLGLAGGLRDACPDAWGRRVILNKLFGKAPTQAAEDSLDETTFMLESGSDRIGALDFQQSPTHYVPRSSDHASLEELLRAAQLIEQGIPLSPELDQALRHGSSIGGARPKALLQDGGRKYVAKFSSSTDTMNVVKAEFIMMRLASRLGIDAAPVRLERALGKDVLLIERFDRVEQGGAWQRKLMVSALTLQGLDEMMARYTSYENLTHIIRKQFKNPKADLRELFRRLVFNVLCGNTDDHARNHAAFFDGQHYALTPAYDICPQVRSGNVASQGMLIIGAANQSQVSLCLEAAHLFLLAPAEAQAIVSELIEGIGEHWALTCQEAAISPVDRNQLATRQMLNPFCFEGLAIPALAQRATAIRATLPA